MVELMVALATRILETQITGETVIDERLRSVLGRRLLDQLRTEVIRNWVAGDAPDTELAPLMLAMEKIREAIERPLDQSFAAHLRGVDGMELLVNVAHDLRSPLTSILFLAEALQRGQSGPVNDVQRRQLGLIYTAALGLNAVASDIIDVTRSDQFVEPAPIPFSVEAALEAVRDIVRPMAEEKQLSLRMQPSRMDQRLGHPIALSRVLLNLTTNALKFTDQGYVEVTALDVDVNRIEFAVRDSGRGIDPATVATLFDPMRKVAGRAGRLFSQTGLGLSICRKLVEAMGSELRVETRVGWGTRFSFVLELPPCPPRRTPIPQLTSIPNRKERRSRSRSES
ncbi:MAG TPA: HAMP domain-containing sensor histidine kinase [Gemmatimonadales bacterium]|nr:HAMP domain-containing sensor histidine kinase [Gemmatimonadales bacterium]